MQSYLILIGAQLFFTTSDLLARHYVSLYGFRFQNFISLWFIAFILLKAFAITAQLYIFSQFQLGKTMALFGAVSIILSNVLGFLLLNEVLTLKEYVGIVLAIAAILVIALGRS